MCAGGARTYLILRECCGTIFGMRLDIALVSRNLYSTRARAVAAIKSGLVTVNGARAQKPSMDVADTDVIVGGALPYSTGRGSLKLGAALDAFGINPAGYVCLDVGASTGGFTETLLSRGASHVLVDSLKNDARVTVLEQTDIRSLSPIRSVDLIVVDVSFISLTNISDALVAWNAPQIVALIKPQFEVSRNVAARAHGVIKSESERAAAIQNVVQNFEKNGYKQSGIIESPIRGGSGNVEYLALLRRVAQ